MRYCQRCILPDTRPNIRLDADGVCNACRAHGTKPVIDWSARAEAFRSVVRKAKARSAGYDCLIPVSGGKDSTWQVVTCLEHGLNPLAVTWKTPGRTPLGQRNLDNLVSLGVDHIDYQISPIVERKFMLKTLIETGSTAVPMHLAIFNIPLKIAARFDIPLVIYGENSAFEYGSAAEAHEGFRLDSSWLKNYGVTHGTSAADWVGPDLSRRELTPYFGPSDGELDTKGVVAVFLGYYFEWNPHTITAIAQAHGFRAGDSARTGVWNFADIDDDFISIHHYLKWYKFGMTRAFDNLSIDIRNGLLTREQAVAAVRQLGDQTPHEDIAKFCAFAGITPARFFQIIEKFRNPAIWRKEDGVWRIPGFLIADWRWT